MSNHSHPTVVIGPYHTPAHATGDPALAQIAIVASGGEV